ncbi:MAG TPA: TRAP transporter small permease [Spirochaetales bacterium]|nr:TRAP transporter small permease [Spirochaetales bacterium]
MKVFTRIMDEIMKIVSWFLIGILGLMTLTLFISVLTRYLLSKSIPWSDPLARYGQTWIMLLGSSLALRKGLHIGIDNFINMLPIKIRQVVLHINAMLIFIFACLMTVQGFRLINIASDQTIPEMGIPMAWIYYMIPVGGILLMLTSIEVALKGSISTLVSKE